MKVSKAIVDNLIKEEFQKLMVKQKLSKRLSQINEELKRMDSEDDGLEEVSAGPLEKTNSSTGLKPGNQYSSEFEKIGDSTLKEYDEESEIDMNSEDCALGEFETKFAEIGKAIDAKLAGEADMEKSMEDDEDFEEVEVSDDEAKEVSDDAEKVEVSDDVEEIEESVSQINESKSRRKVEGKNIFTEGVDGKKKAAMLSEINRMKKFAGLSKDEE